MKKTKVLTTLTAFALFGSSLYAHPGHPGHDEWPFDDFKMVAFTIIGLLAVAAVLFKRHSPWL